MPFRDPSQRKFLFAMDKDKQKGLNPMQVKSQPAAFSLPKLNLPQIGMPPAAPAQANFGLPKQLSPTAVPSLPALPKQEKFGKIKNYLKKQKTIS